MDVAAEVMILAQALRHPHDLFHGVVGAADNAGREKQTLDIIAAIEVERQFDGFLDRKSCPLHVRGGAIDAVKAIVVAGIGEQDFQERNAASVRRIGMTNSHPGIGRSHAFAVAAVPRFGSTGGAGGVVLGGIRQNGQFLLHIHL